MLKFRPTVLATAIIAAALTSAAQQTVVNPALNQAIRTIFATTEFVQTAISADGKQVAWVEKIVSKNGADEGKAAIYVARVDGSQARRISAGAKSNSYDERELAWSPDGKRLAFLSDAVKAGQRQLYIADVSSGQLQKLTNVRGFLDSPRWTPDGKTLAVLFTENAGGETGPLVAEAAQTGVIKDAVTEQRLGVVDASGANFRQITPADMYVYEYDWSPDGKRLVVTAAHGNGDNNWYIAQLYTLAADGTGMKSIYKPPLQIANPAWSPDGNSIAFIGGLMSDEGVTGGDVFVVPSEGGKARNITPELRGSAASLTWQRDGKIIFAEWVDGGTAVASVSPEDARPQTLWKGDDRLGTNDSPEIISLSSDGRSSAAVRQSFSSAPEVWAGPIGDWKQITSRNAALKPSLGEGKSIHWNNEGFDLQGWLLYPKNFDATRKYPMVVDVHGGPSSMAHSAWPGRHSFGMALSAAGYFVLLPNPRGSYGEGEKFTQANVQDFGYGDWRDILKGVDAAIKQAPIDEHRLGLTGWSYGGYMTMWGVTQTNRFAAAVAGAGLANFQSYYGENAIDQWMIPFFGASVYDDPAVYARSSPITFIKNAKTPTLILVGDSDGECPTPQSYEFWHALKTLGVENEFVVYAHEGHQFRDPAHQRDVVERAATWFDQHLK
jgi:dipeptidyl aminopeptidase/acylaminoacyl peptidase